MNICPTCGKPIAWQGTLTYHVDVATGTYTTTGQFSVGDMCLGHTTLTASAAWLPIQPQMMPTQSQKESTPQAFLDAFKDEELRP